MSTEKLYYQDSYIEQFEATVTKVGDGFIVLDRTAFFPGGGGQECDDGWIDGIRVSAVGEELGEVRHYSEGRFSLGQKVLGRLHFEERLRKMRNHTAEHMFCGLAHTRYGAENVGFHLSDTVTFDLSSELDREQIAGLEREVNENVLQNLPVRAWFPEKQEVVSLPFRSKLELDEMPELRLVQIGDVDLCACCAPHVRMTGEIGLVKILSAERHRGGMRLVLVAGLDAYEAANQYQRSVTAISGLLSSPRNEVADSVSALLRDRDRLRYEKTGLELDLVRHLPLDDNCVFVRLSEEAQRAYCNILKEHHPVAAVFCEGKYIIGSRSVDLRRQAKEINEAISGRGGGRSEMISGTAAADSDTIHNYFKKYL